MSTTDDPLDPLCPCASGNRLRGCCALTSGSDESDAETDPVLLRLIAFGARDEFAAPRRRLNRALLADLPAAQLEALERHREVEMQSAVIAFLHMDLPCARGDSLGTLLLRREGAAMPAPQRSALANMVAHPTSLYEVLDVFPGKGLELRDLLRHFTVRVRERKASTMIEPGWLLLTKLRRQPDGTPVMDLPLLPFNNALRPAIDTWLRTQLHNDPSRRIDPRSVVNELYLLWQREIATAMTQPPPTVHLQNHHGDLLEECEAELECDGERLLKWLRQAPDWMPDQEADDSEDANDAPRAWVWFEQNADGTRLTLAEIAIAGDRVLLHVNSRRRLERAKIVLREAANAMLVNLNVQTIDELRARAAHAAASKPREPETRSVEQERVLQHAMDAHYRKWIDEAVPMFGNRTPRQMARVDPEAVSRAIRTICNGPPGCRYDASWMYAELRVRRFGGGDFAPGLVAN